VAKQFLDGANVVAVFQQMGRKRMSKGMRRGGLGDLARMAALRTAHRAPSSCDPCSLYLGEGQRLILGGCTDLFINRKEREKRCDFRLAHLFRMSFVVKENESAPKSGSARDFQSKRFGPPRPPIWAAGILHGRSSLNNNPDAAALG